MFIKYTSLQPFAAMINRDSKKSAHANGQSRYMARLDLAQILSAESNFAVQVVLMLKCNEIRWDHLWYLTRTKMYSLSYRLPMIENQ